MRNLILGVTLIAVFSVILFIAIPKGIWVPARLGPGAVSPAAWPRLITIGVMLLGLALIVQGTLQLRREGRLAKPARVTADDALSLPLASAKVAAALALLVLYFWFLHVLGIVLTSMIALPLFSLLYGEKRLRVLIPIAVLLPVALYYFFTVVAHIPMPTGIFG